MTVQARRIVYLVRVGTVPGSSIGSQIPTKLVAGVMLHHQLIGRCRSITPIPSLSFSHTRIYLSIDLQEGHKIWEEILTVSRNLSRLVTLYRPEVGNERLDRIKNLIASFPYLPRHPIRSGCLCQKIMKTCPSNHGHSVY
jgi:predicted membrane chloride channel (bestrophin family)